MNTGHEIVVELIPEVASALRARNRPVDLAELGIEGSPARLDVPDVDDVGGAARLTLHVTDAREAAQLVSRLQSHHWVTAAYVKPSAQPPGASDR